MVGDYYYVAPDNNAHEFEVMPGSIKIDAAKYQEVMEELGFSPLDALDIFPQTL